MSRKKTTPPALPAQLGWSHFVEIIPLKEPLKREFYAEMCRVERWSVRTLREKIGGMLFERTALYLRWLEKHERKSWEEAPLGLILCESAGVEQVELLQLEASGIRAATYLTELPPKAVLEKKIRAAAELARERLLAASEPASGEKAKEDEDLRGE